MDTKSAQARLAPLITDLVQVSVVVRDLDATMKHYVETAGIGPWAVYDNFGPPDVTDILVRGEPATYRVRLALTWTKDRMWEIIQPVGPSVYQEFIDERGEGMHHTLVAHAGHRFDDVVARFGAGGCETLMTFRFRGIRFAFIDAMRALKMYVVVLGRPEGTTLPPKRPATPPDRWYPFEPGPDHVW